MTAALGRIDAFERELPDEAATARLGQDLALALRPGDAVALSGDLGAGKTSLARALIRAMAGDPALEVPSPTFTLVQVYELRLPIHHFDLYRLSSPDELDELGLDEALAGGAALIEWPERAGGRLPPGALHVELVHHGDGRLARISGSGGLIERVGRSLAIRDFLGRAGWSAATRAYLTGDASARSYETVELPDQPRRILMNSPRLVLGPPVRDGKPYAEIAHSAQTVAAFVGVDRALAAQGFSVPEIFASDLDRGFLLISDLGSEGFLDPEGRPVATRYAAAAELLAVLHGKRWQPRLEVTPGVSHEVPPFDREAMLIEADLLIDWYFPYVTGRPADQKLRDGYRAAWNAVLDRLAKAETSLVLRDVHSPNIIWREERQGIDRLGLLDFQDALIGPSAYDVASLALDARVTVPVGIERSTVAAYVASRRKAGAFDEEAFAAAYAIMAAQRNAKILGIFVRLDRRDGKPAYLKHLPRIRDYLSRVIGHPSLRDVREFLEEHGLLDGAASQAVAKIPTTAMVLAAGLGKRMRPITDRIPKPLVEIAGRTLLDRGLDALATVGVEKAIVNVHYLPDQIIAHVAGQKHPMVVISDERDGLLDSAGGIVKALPALGSEPFYILNADTFWVDRGLPNLQRLALEWDASRMDILLMLADLDSATGHSGGTDFLVAPDGKLSRAKGDPSGLIYAGAAIVDPRLFAGASATPHSLNRYFDAAIEAGRLYGMKMEGHWITVGTPDAIPLAEAAVARALAAKR